MSGEAKIRVSLEIAKNDEAGIIRYRSYPNEFTADVTGAMGPTPGAINVDDNGTDVDLSLLDTPGLCRITSEAATGYVTYGIRDTSSDTFYPLGELLPGEIAQFRLSRLLGVEYTAGTGTSGSGNVLHMRASVGVAAVLVEAFEA